MVVVDNSESSRNGDYQPTRFEAQADAVNIIFQSIVQGNPESSVGLMSMGGKGPEVLVTLTTDAGKILDGLHRTKKQISGKANLAVGIQIAGVCNLQNYFPIFHLQNQLQRETRKEKEEILILGLGRSSPSSTARTSRSASG